MGAHVGFFSQRFASWVGETGHVVALEPEPINYARLCRRVHRTGLSARVTTLNAAAVERPGDYFLRLDPWHPGDHQIASAGLPVGGVTLDEVLALRGWPPVSLIKLDIQGAEARALAGARETLERLRPTLLVEVDELRLRRQGSSARQLFDLLAAKGYRPRHLTHSGVSPVMATVEALGAAGEVGGYADFLFPAPASSLESA